MKKIVSVLAVAMAASLAQAQYDTVQYPDPNYLYVCPPLLMQSYRNDVEGDGEYAYEVTYNVGNSNYGLLIRYAVGDTDTIYGVAMTLWSPYNLEIRYPIIYVSDNDGNYYLAAEVHEERLHKKRYFRYDAHPLMDTYYELDTSQTVTGYVPCHEYYFDEPVVSPGPYVLVGWHQAVLGFDSSIYMFHGLSWPRNDGQYAAIEQNLPNVFPTHTWGGMMPIVQLRCAAPRDVRLLSVADERAVLRWRADEANCGLFQLALYPMDQPMDSAAVVTTEATLQDGYRLYETETLDPGVNYALRVRSVCHYTTATYDTTVYSEWSQPAYFRVQPVGIGAAEMPAFGLRPNPATDMATVELGLPAEAGTAVEVLDMAGRRVLSQPVDLGASRAGLDLRGLEAGVYMVSLTTPQGVATRRLVKR